jgi:hypothetical protein
MTFCYLFFLLGGAPFCVFIFGTGVELLGISVA